MTKDCYYYTKKEIIKLIKQLEDDIIIRNDLPLVTLEDLDRATKKIWLKELFEERNEKNAIRQVEQQIEQRERDDENVGSRSV
jgi:hypothetical protein